MTYNLAAVRELVSRALSDGELNDLCFGHFRPVYDEFTTGQTRAADGRPGLRVQTEINCVASRCVG
jgi:hypothetical protein